MARALRCYYTGQTGMKCENCVLADQQYCGNYIPHSPYCSRPTRNTTPAEKSKLVESVINSLEKLGFRKL